MQPPPLVLVRRSRRQWYCYNQTSAAATAIGFNKAAASAVAFNQSLTGGCGETGMTRASRHFLFDFTQKPIKHHHHRVKSNRSLEAYALNGAEIVRGTVSYGKC